MADDVREIMRRACEDLDDWTDGCLDWSDVVHAQLAALAAAGWVVARAEPTDTMKRAGELAIIDGGAPDFLGDNAAQTMSARLSPHEAARVYKAMVTAPPEEKL